MTSGVHSLPIPASNQAFCDVSALEAGFLPFRCNYAVAGVHENDQHLAPILAFLITHAPSGKRLVFDLGMNLDEDNLGVTPAMRETLKDSGIYINKDVVASLQDGGIEPDDVNVIVLSHIHADHVGNPAKFKKARFLVGNDSRGLFESGYPVDPKSFFDSRLLPKDRTDYFDPHGEDWKPIGPFERAFDYFNDGSLYFIDAPGHLPGHINLLARTSSDGAWIYLAADSAHDWRLVRGQAEIAVSHHPVYGVRCAHTDVEAAKDTIRRIGEVMRFPRVRVLLAHDNEWYEQNKDGKAFWPGKIPSL
ncbi:Metallo-hydrolase/oxidoreductase [Fomitiporia mediterranea MF3/22]|uniref:Metallo-hydrolase/oxidoreductase n=1 Tax=Fomitiporia mediterranea (strain MF3/22) TaxID=694068 RepID=UPI0004409C51|nr:Metallo-hydrolase/oxidoreductase [Fomitiporia mediterranea MF3/22]EJD06990.1 Metallo-hydrolase/oxidoreductase [Fomitiporia mediterranea MF3/22]